jgi:hypothetical protein
MNLQFILSEGAGRRQRRISGATATFFAGASIAAPPEILRRFAAQDKLE